jgi:hypothetical protein
MAFGHPVLFERYWTIAAMAPVERDWSTDTTGTTFFTSTEKLGLMHHSPAERCSTEAIPLLYQTRLGCGAKGPPMTAARRTLGAEAPPSPATAGPAPRSSEAAAQ